MEELRWQDERHNRQFGRAFDITYTDNFCTTKWSPFTRQLRDCNNVFPQGHCPFKLSIALIDKRPQPWFRAQQRILQYTWRGKEQSRVQSTNRSHWRPQCQNGRPTTSQRTIHIRTPEIMQTDYFGETMILQSVISKGWRTTYHH